MNNYELNVYIPDDANLNISIGNFINLYSSRKNSNEEFWLLDVTYWSSINNIIEPLQHLKLDLDDDLYLYFPTENALNIIDKKQFSIWEYYEIHYSRPRKILPYGNWSEEVFVYHYSVMLFPIIHICSCMNRACE